MPRADRLAIAARRLRRVLTTHTVAHARTLEQKISDAGPGHLRVDPHLLTEARRDLITAQEIALIPDEHGAWFSLSTTPLPEVRGRLAVLRPLHNRFVAPAVSQRTGQALEIAVFRALSTQQRLGFLGAFRDLDDHDDATPYSKVEPPSHLSGRSIPNDRSLD